jgi:hypothetical protein
MLQVDFPVIDTLTDLSVQDFRLPLFAIGAIFPSLVAAVCYLRTPYSGWLSRWHSGPQDACAIGTMFAAGVGGQTGAANVRHIHPGA